MTFNYSTLVGEQSVVCLSVCVCLSLCLSVCLSVCEHMSVTAGPIFTNFCVPWPWLGPPLAALRYVIYFQFMDDVMFGHSVMYKLLQAMQMLIGLLIMNIHNSFSNHL